MAITFTNHGLSNNVLFGDTEGAYQFTPGLRARRLEIVALPRGLGELVKDLGSVGATHTLVLTFIGVLPADVASVRARIQSCLTGTTGTLTVPESGTFPHCVCLEAEEGPQSPAIKNVTASAAGTRCYTMTFRLTFRQLRG